MGNDLGYFEAGECENRTHQRVFETLLYGFEDTVLNITGPY